MTHIITLANQKGGIGKTTVTINLAAGLYRATGYRPCIIDTDPQSNCTSTLLRTPQRNQITYDVGDWILNRNRAYFDNLVQRLEWCDLVPATRELEITQDAFNGLANPYTGLRNAIKREKLTDRYEFILIDCPPALGKLTKNALNAATGFIVPFDCEFYCFDGYAALMEEIGKIRRETNKLLRHLGIVFNKYHEKERDSVMQAFQREVARQHQQYLLSTYIRSNKAVIKKLPIKKQTVFELAPDSHAAADFTNLTSELLAKLEPVAV